MIQKRNHRTETTYGPERTFTTPDGEVVYQGPTSSVTRGVFEYDCAVCGREHTSRGIVDAIIAADESECLEAIRARLR